MTSTRIEYFDNLKGILIFLVVFGHILEGAGGYINERTFNLIYSFHMPLFIFVSGIFVKRSSDINSTLKKAIYFLSLGLLFHISLRLFSFVILGGSLDNFNLFAFTSIPWYLISVGMYILLTPVISILKPSFAIFSSIIFTTIANIWTMPDFFSIERSVIYLPFYLAGFYMSPQKLINSKFVRGSLKSIVAFVILALVCIFIYLVPENVTNHIQWYSSALRSYSEIWGVDFVSKLNNLFVAMTLRMLWYFFVGVISSAVMVLVPRSNKPLLTRIGEHSLSIYIFHAFIFYSLQHYDVVNVLLPSEGLFSFALCFVISVAIVIVIGIPLIFSKPFISYNKQCKKLADRICV